MTAGFRALRTPGFRLWVGSALIANTGDWMQRTAQDWLVLTELTDHDGGATGAVIAMQFLPVLLFAPFTGALADRYPKRRLLITSQVVILSSALASCVLVLTGAVRMWTVFLCALWLGCGSALDLPARQAFIAELVPVADLTSAVGLNGVAMNLARMLGPAGAGVVIAAWGTGPAFAITAACSLAVLAALSRMRNAAIPAERPLLDGGSLREGLRYLGRRRDLITIFVCTGLVSLFAAHSALVTAMMATTVFAEGAGQYGVLVTAIACGSITASLLAARRSRPSLRVLAAGALCLGTASAMAAVAPGFRLYAAILFPLGIGIMTFFLTSTTLVQLATERHLHGRVLALLSVIQIGAIAIGSPIAGWVGTRFGARWAHVDAAVAALVAGAICLVTIRYRKGVVAELERAVTDAGRAPRVVPQQTEDDPPDDAAQPAAADWSHA